MPFTSKSQQRYLYARHPEIAEKFAEHTPKKAYKRLPEHVGEPESKKEVMKRLSHKFMRSKKVN